MKNHNYLPYRFIMMLVSVCMLISMAFNAHALHQSDVQKYSTLHVMTDKDSLKPGDSLWLLVHIQLQPDWYTYYQNPGDSGLPPKVNASLPEGFELSDFYFKPPTIITVGDLVDYGYYNNAYYLLNLKTPQNFTQDKAKVALNFDWVTCKDMCIPQSGQVAFSIAFGDRTDSAEKSFVDDHLSVYQGLESTQGSALISDKLLKIQLPIIKDERVKNPYLYVGQHQATKDLHKQTFQRDNGHITFTVEKGTAPIDQLSGFVKLDENQFIKFTVPKSQIEFTSQNLTPPSPSFSFWLALGFAFLGGLILNIMPCVFPILALKVLSLAKMKGANSLHRINHGFVYALGIVLGFVLLATVLVVLQGAGHAAGWGFQMQSPIFLGVMAYILFLVSMNLFGFIEFIIPLPVSVGEHHEYSLKSSLYAGLLITLIATPCTAPFMAPAIGYALTQPFYVIYGVFIALGLGLASPFLIATWVPSLTRVIPKPGPWLMKFKQVLAFPMLLTTVWLLWVLMKSTSPDFVAYVLAGMTVIGFYVWYRHTYPKSSITKRMFMFILTIGLAAMPFMSTLTDDETNHETFTVENLNKTLVQGDNIFVNVTADWCLTCKVNEKIIFNDEMNDFFKKQNVRVLTVDWTKPNAEITKYLQTFGRSGVPLYVYYKDGKNPVVLPQVLTKATLKSTISHSSMDE